RVAPAPGFDARARNWRSVPSCSPSKRRHSRNDASRAVQLQLPERNAMKRLRNAAAAAVFAVSGTFLAVAASAEAPQYVVDPFWSKPVADKWILGQVSGIAVDNEDNVWIVHRPSTLVDDEKGAQKNPPETRCCKAAPPVLQFSGDGRLLRSWGGAGAGYDWP